MEMSERARTTASESKAMAQASRRRSARSLAWLGGGTHGNEQLTATVGALLLGLLALLGVTILRIGQLLSEHLFLGLLLIGPVVLKMATTGYRFARYYAHNPTYRHKGPPELILRLIAPLVALSTVVVFVSGVVLLFDGPGHRDVPLMIHKVSFIAWLVVIALHVLGHLPRLGRSLRMASTSVPRGGISPGRPGRALAVLGAFLAGIVLAVSLIPQYHVWSASGAIPHHEHHRG